MFEDRFLTLGVDMGYLAPHIPGVILQLQAAARHSQQRPPRVGDLLQKNGILRAFQCDAIAAEQEKRRSISPSHRIQPSIRNQVFVSYSHRNNQWLDRLQDNLKPLVRKGIIEIWADTQINPGSPWYEQIQEALRLAKVAILLVTPEYLASDFIAERELPPLLEAAESEGLIITWIAVSASLYKETDIAKYKALNDPTQPLDRLTRAMRNQVLVEICLKIKDALGFPGIAHSH